MRLLLAVRTDDVEAVTPHERDTVDSDEALNIATITSTDNDHRALGGELADDAPGFVRENSQLGARDDGRQRPVVVQEDHDALAVDALLDLVNGLERRG